MRARVVEYFKKRLQTEKLPKTHALWGTFNRINALQEQDKLINAVLAGDDSKALDLFKRTNINELDFSKAKQLNIVKELVDHGFEETLKFVLKEYNWANNAEVAVLLIQMKKGELWSSFGIDPNKLAYKDSNIYAAADTTAANIKSVQDLANWLPVCMAADKNLFAPAPFLNGITGRNIQLYAVSGAKTNRDGIINTLKYMHLEEKYFGLKLEDRWMQAAFESEDVELVEALRTRGLDLKRSASNWWGDSIFEKVKRDKFLTYLLECTKSDPQLWERFNSNVWNSTNKELLNNVYSEWFKAGLHLTQFKSRVHPFVERLLPMLPLEEWDRWQEVWNVKAKPGTSGNQKRIAHFGILAKRGDIDAERWLRYRSIDKEDEERAGHLISRSEKLAKKRGYPSNVSDAVRKCWGEKSKIIASALSVGNKAIVDTEVLPFLEEGNYPSWAFVACTVGAQNRDKREGWEEIFLACPEELRLSMFCSVVPQLDWEQVTGAEVLKQCLSTIAEGWENKLTDVTRGNLLSVMLKEWPEKAEEFIKTGITKNPNYIAAWVLEAAKRDRVGVFKLLASDIQNFEPFMKLDNCVNSVGCFEVLMQVMPEANKQTLWKTVNDAYINRKSEIKITEFITQVDLIKYGFKPVVATLNELIRSQPSYVNTCILNGTIKPKEYSTDGNQLIDAINFLTTKTEPATIELLHTLIRHGENPLISNKASLPIENLNDVEAEKVLELLIRTANHNLENNTEKDVMEVEIELE